MTSAHNIHRLILYLVVLPFGILSFVWYLITFVNIFAEVPLTPQLMLPPALAPASGFRRRSTVTSHEDVVAAHGRRRYWPSTVELVFAVYIPTALMMLLSLSVLVWLIVVGVAKPQSYIRSIRSELRALGAFSVLGLSFMLWSIIGLMVMLGKMNDPLPSSYWLSLWHILLFVWGWIFVATLFIAWVWEYVSAKKFPDQHHESLRTIEDDNDSLYSGSFNGKEPAHRNFA